MSDTKQVTVQKPHPQVEIPLQSLSQKLGRSYTYEMASLQSALVTLADFSVATQAKESAAKALTAALGTLRSLENTCTYTEGADLVREELRRLALDTLDVVFAIKNLEMAEGRLQDIPRVLKARRHGVTSLHSQTAGRHRWYLQPETVLGAVLAFGLSVGMGLALHK